jgi:molybdopterin-guanine dinucleotide biosynthesis protein A
MDAVIPAGPTGAPEPLCAVYHRRCAAHIARALDGGIRKVMDGLAGLEVQVWRIEESKYFRNLNTPEEWHCYSHG